MEKANPQDKGKGIVEDVSIDLTLDLPMETQMEYWRQRNLLPPMDTEMEWRQQNYPFFVTRRLLCRGILKSSEGKGWRLK
uniref:Uncharacterized protein n=1 Tax=Solanum lycopersicum TaxID=4081 RepID=A0A3Q7EWU1_SOLLC